MSDPTTPSSVGPADNDRSAFRDAAHRYLQDRHCVLWGEKFSVWRDGDRERAVDWIEDLFDGIYEQLRQQQETRSE